MYAGIFLKDAPRGLRRLRQGCGSEVRRRATLHGGLNPATSGAEAGVQKAPRSSDGRSVAGSAGAPVSRRTRSRVREQSYVTVAGNNVRCD